MSVLNSLKRLFPSGKSFRNIKDNLLAIVGGCADAIEDVKTFLKKVLTNFLPDTADDMIDEWLETLNVWKSENLSLIEKQKKAAGRYQSLVGGQDITYLQAIIDTAYSGSVTIQEVLPPDGTYNVVGTVANTEDFIRLKGIIETIMPAALGPVYDIDLLSEEDFGIVGRGLVGIAIVNKTS